MVISWVVRFGEVRVLLESYFCKGFEGSFCVKLNEMFGVVLIM